MSGTLPAVSVGGTPQAIALGGNNPVPYNFAAEPIITVADVACTNTDISFATGDAAPHNWNFGAGATPATSTSSPATVQYTSTGRKTITYDGNTYTDFWNILIPNQTPTITASATSICPGTNVSFTTDLIGAAYQWQIASDPAFTSIVATGTTQNYAYTFTTAGTYYVRHQRYTDCCGWSSWSNVVTVTVHPIPAAPTASGSSPVCRGSALVYTATAPAGVTFEWYTAATGGTLAGTGATLTIPFTSGAAAWPTNYNAPGTYTLYVEAVSPQGCRSSRTPVSITVNQIPAPTAPNVSRCGPGPVVLTATYTGPGTPTYNWWDAPTGGTLLQTGGSNTYIATVTTSTTFYVSVVVPGCVESARAPVTVTVNAPPATDTWTGAVSTDWFDPGNWASGCVPTCGTSVTIPAPLTRYPTIGTNLIPATCNDITIAAGASLTFSSPTAELQVCGHFNHNGALNTTAGGRVRFVGSGVQNYARTATATGTFYQVIVDKGAAPLAVRRVEVTQLPMVITNQLHFIAGRIATLATNHVQITNSNPVSITGHSIDNYIQGRLRRAIQAGGGLYALPVGDIHPAQLATGKGYQLALLNLDPTTITEVLAYFTPIPQTTPTLAEPYCGTNYTCTVDNGFWTIQVVGGSWAAGQLYDLTLYPRGYTTCNALPYYSIMKREGGPWYLNGTCCSPSTLVGGVCRNDFNNGFSDFVIVGSSTPLPVTTLTLSAEGGASAIALTWKADQEDNVTRYQLRRSTDLQTFVPIATQLATGDGQYTYLDTEVEADQTYYYRVVALGAMGEEVLQSNLAQARLNLEGQPFSVRLEPNPTRGGTWLICMLPEQDSLETRVYNSLGQLIWLHRGHYGVGSSRLALPSGEWPHGLYAVEVRGTRYSWSGKLMRE